MRCASLIPVQLLAYLCFFGIGQKPSAIKSVICITSVCVFTDRFTLKLNALKLGNVINTFIFICSTATFVKKHPKTQYY